MLKDKLSWYFKAVPQHRRTFQYYVPWVLKKHLSGKRGVKDRKREKWEQGVKDMKFYRDTNHNKVRVESVLDIPRAGARTWKKTAFSRQENDYSCVNWQRPCSWRWRGRKTGSLQPRHNSSLVYKLLGVDSFGGGEKKHHTIKLNGVNCCQISLVVAINLA